MIQVTKTKIPRSFIVSGRLYEICQKYIKLRQQVMNPSTNQFFLNYQRGKCTNQVVGLNKIGNVPTRIAEYLKLPDPKMYTSHCLRRTSATIFVDSGGDLIGLKRHGGWKSSTTAEGYVDDSINNKTLTANRIIESIENNYQQTITSETTTNATYIYSNTHNSIQEEFAMDVPSTSTHSKCKPVISEVIPLENTPDKGSLVIQNCHNFTINFYNK